MVIFTGNMIINQSILGNQFSGEAGCEFSPPCYQLGFPMPSACEKRADIPGWVHWVHWVHWTLSHSPSMNLRMLHAAAVHPLCQLFQRPLEARIRQSRDGLLKTYRGIKAQQFLLFAVMNHHTSRKLYHRTIGFCNV